MIELPADMPGAGLDDRRKMVRLVAPHRPHNRQLIDHAAQVRKPIGDRNPRLAVAGELSLAIDNGPLHLGQVVAEPDDVDHLARPLVIFRIERVDVADPATHEQKDNRLRLGRQRRSAAESGCLCPLSLDGRGLG